MHHDENLFGYPTPETPPTLEELFDKFHADHPDVYDELVALARRGVRAGRTKLGIGQLYEVLRWQRALRGLPGDEEFKLNNNHRAFYARLIMATEPDLADIFETRAQVAT